MAEDASTDTPILTIKRLNSEAGRRRRPRGLPPCLPGCSPRPASTATSLSWLPGDRGIARGARRKLPPVPSLYNGGFGLPNSCWNAVTASSPGHSDALGHCDAGIRRQLRRADGHRPAPRVQLRRPSASRRGRRALSAPATRPRRRGYRGSRRRSRTVLAGCRSPAAFRLTLRGG